VIAIRSSVAVDGKSQSVVRDPANRQWKTDLVLSLWRCASVLEQQGAPQKREAGVNYQRALEILRPLAIENRLTADRIHGSPDLRPD